MDYSSNHYHLSGEKVRDSEKVLEKHEELQSIQQDDG